MKLVYRTPRQHNHGWHRGKFLSFLTLSSSADYLQASLDRVVLDPQITDLLAILKGARNGFIYGAKIRFPHALVYDILPVSRKSFG